MEEVLYLFYDNNEQKYLREELIRKLDYEENVEYLKQNQNEILNGSLEIKSACDFIINAIEGDIEEVVKDLNKCWEYNISIFKKIN